MTYAKYGQYVLEQPQHIAYQIFDSKIQPLLQTTSDYSTAPCVEAKTIEELAEALEINVSSLVTDGSGI